MGTCIPPGTADATGEKTRFQAKNRFFHSGVSFFYARNKPVFPLEKERTQHGRYAMVCRRAASERVEGAAFVLRQAPKRGSTVHPSLLTHCKRNRNQSRGAARHFPGSAWR
jgi:hypothetical protein